METFGTVVPTIKDGTAFDTGQANSVHTYIVKVAWVMAVRFLDCVEDIISCTIVFHFGAGCVCIY
jgi:hypothetical protein